MEYPKLTQVRPIKIKKNHKIINDILKSGRNISMKKYIMNQFKVQRKEEYPHKLYV